MPSAHLELPVKAVPFDAEREAAIRKSYPNIRAPFLRGVPGNHVMYEPMWAGAPQLYNFEVKRDDVWLVGFPKSGTTWLQEIVWLINHNCNFEEARKTNVYVRIPLFEMCFMPGEDPNVNSPLPKMFPTLEQQRNMPSPRHFKTHLPFHLLPPGTLDTVKVVYVARNPKDVIVSYFHHHQLLKDYNLNGTIDDFAEHFMRDEVPRTPYFGQVLEAWSKRDHPNMLFMFYEDLKSNLRGEIEKVAKFLGKELSEEQMNALLEHSTFDSCKKNMDFTKVLQGSKVANAEVQFFRKGKTGDWKNHFSPETNARLDQWIAKNLAGTGLSFKMELEQQD